jgi:hypothetical protein
MKFSCEYIEQLATDSLQGMKRQIRGLGEILFALKIDLIPYVTQGLKLRRVICTGSWSENLKERDCLEDVSADGRTQLRRLIQV